MNDIVERFHDTKTGRLTRVCVEPERDHFVVGLIKFESGFNNHPHVRVANIRQEGGVYKAVWFRGPDDQSFDEAEYRDPGELIAALERAIQARDAE